MRIKIKDLKQIILETLQTNPRSASVTVDMLTSFQDRLDDMLMSGELTQPQYEKEWNDILASVGWTDRDYEREIDRRWDYVDSTRDVPVYSKNYGAN